MATICIVGRKLKLLIPLILLFFSLPAFAGQEVPDEFIGKWVPLKKSCSSDIGLIVNKKSVVLLNGSDTLRFGNLDICPTCEGGMQYGGIVVWLLPEFYNGAPDTFTVYFNAGEEKGITVVDFLNEDLKKRFPLHMMELKKCVNR